MHNGPLLELSQRERAVMPHGAALIAQLLDETGKTMRAVADTCLNLVAEAPESDLRELFEGHDPVGLVHLEPCLASLQVAAVVSLSARTLSEHLVGWLDSFMGVKHLLRTSEPAQWPEILEQPGNALDTIAEQVEALAESFRERSHIGVSLPGMVNPFDGDF